MEMGKERYCKVETLVNHFSESYFPSIKHCPAYSGFCPAAASAQNVRLATKTKSYQRENLGTIVITLWPWPATWQQSHSSGWEHFSLRQPSRYICYFTSRVYVFWRSEAFWDFCYLKVKYNARQDKGHRGTKSLLMKGRCCSLKSQQ